MRDVAPGAQGFDGILRVVEDGVVHLHLHILVLVLLLILVPHFRVLRDELVLPGVVIRGFTRRGAQLDIVPVSVFVVPGSRRCPGHDREARETPGRSCDCDSVLSLRACTDPRGRHPVERRRRRGD